MASVSMKKRWRLLFAATIFGSNVVAVLAQESGGYTNLQILDADISRQELGSFMLQNSLGLGLPRRQSEGCLYCHVGDMDKPVTEWDFASDEKEAKLQGRTMMAMVRDINAQHLSKLDGRDESVEVTCATCHRGRTDPRPLPVVLREIYKANGIGKTIARYRDLRERYFGAGAYDFRPAVLIRLADEMATNAAWDDALLLARLNEEVNPNNPAAARARLSLQVRQQIDEHGVTTALDFFVRAATHESDGVVDYSVLDGVGWSIYREDQTEAALQVFRRNLQLFPDQFIPNESLGDALWFADDRSGGIAVFEAWVARQPENEMGRRRLLNMREQLDATPN